MCHVTIYCKVIGPHCTVQRDKAPILDSPDPYCTLQSQVVTYYEVLKCRWQPVTDCPISMESSWNLYEAFFHFCFLWSHDNFPSRLGVSMWFWKLTRGKLEGFICSQSFDSLMIIGDFNTQSPRKHLLSPAPTPSQLSDTDSHNYIAFCQLQSAL